MKSAGKLHNVHHDVQGEQVAVGVYDIGVGLAVVFDGGAFADAESLREFIDSLESGLALLEEMETRT